MATQKIQLRSAQIECCPHTQTNLDSAKYEQSEVTNILSNYERGSVNFCFAQTKTEK